FITLFFLFDLGQYFTLDFIKGQQEGFAEFKNQNPLLTVLIFFLIYVTSTALSLPGAALLTLLAGALFGLVQGLIIVSFASTIGATIAFLTSRFLLRDWVQSNFGPSLKVINDGVEKDGAFYLFSLRLIPAVPFFIINLVMGLTPIKTSVFFFVSQVGMLAGTAVYVNAGTQLGKITSLKGILSPSLILSFCLLGAFPIIAKKAMEFIKKKKKK
ncbi:MAG: VTT domain-containing protein, partial [Bdellovibrionales bacterium]|nr:VTT domain-containing protein [Bdellovibrionales bacterium]